jgi:hypothetical protein
MVVASSGADMFATRSAGDDEDTRKELRFRPRSSAASTATMRSQMGASMMSVSSGEGQVAETLGDSFGFGGAPAALSASGVFRPMPGVHRQVTGLFFPELDQLQVEGKPTSSRVWYAAIDARPRGPFSATEMMSLAERGKIRDATMVWRPGFASWKKVRNGDISTGEDLSWLRKIVLARKLREIDAAERAEETAQTGRMPKVQLTRSKAGGKKPTWTGGAAGMPPALPDDVDDDATTMKLQRDPSREISLPFATLREPSAWRADELPALPKGARGTQRTSLGKRLPMPVAAVAMAALAMATVMAVGSALLHFVDVDMDATPLVESTSAATVASTDVVTLDVVTLDVDTLDVATP